jgi:hypothetical protein
MRVTRSFNPNPLDVIIRLISIFVDYLCLRSFILRSLHDHPAESTLRYFIIENAYPERKSESCNMAFSQAIEKRLAGNKIRFEIFNFDG